MSAPSSRPRELILGAAVAVAVGCKGKEPAPRPEADPAKITTLAADLKRNAPMPASVPSCAPEQLVGLAPMTYRTVLELARATIPPDGEFSVWINPIELDHPAARLLASSGSDDTARKQAAAELLAAPGYFVYRVEIINMPLALGVRELKRGLVAMRGIAYDRAGRPTCATVFNVKNSRKIADWAMDEVEKQPGLAVAPKVVDVLRDELHARLLREAGKAGLPMPTPPAAEPPTTDD